MSALERIAGHAWNRRGAGGAALFAALVPPAVAYSLAARGRNFLYDRGWRRPVRADAAVISVGNLTVGGTGKTPVVIWLANELEMRGFRVAVLSRGYGRKTRGVHIVGEERQCFLSPEEAGDEAALLARRLRAMVVVGERRAGAARLAVERGAEVLVLDDGFQHRALARDLDLLLVDRDRQLANGWTLPAGPLREPSGGAARAHATVVVERTPVPEGERTDWHPVSAVLSQKPCFQATLRPEALVLPHPDGWQEVALGRMGGRRILAVSGIAETESFYSMVRQWEGRIVSVLEFGDHHRYDRNDWKAIMNAAREADMIVTTEKDLVKLEQFPFAQGGLAALRLTVDFENVPGVLDTIEAAIECREGREGARQS